MRILCTLAGELGDAVEISYAFSPQPVLSFRGSVVLGSAMVCVLQSIHFRYQCVGVRVWYLAFNPGPQRFGFRNPNFVG